MSFAQAANTEMRGSAIFKRSLVIENSKTSVSLEQQFWEALGEIADSQNLSRSQLVTRIIQNEEPENLSSAIRVFVLKHFQERRGPEGVDTELKRTR